LGGLLALGFVLTTGATRVTAQQTDSSASAAAPAAATVPAVSSAATDSLLSVVPNRDTAETQREIGTTVQRRAATENAIQRLTQLRSGTQLRVDDMKRRIDGVNDRLKAAKKEKRDADRGRLEAERKALEREKELLERRVALREAEIAVKKKESEGAELERKALELEVQLWLKRSDPTRPAAGTVERASFDQVLSDLERQVLEAQRAAAAKAADVADGEKSVVERRLGILEAQRSVVGGK
jgi:flagellar hook-basal body complex protein FliE